MLLLHPVAIETATAAPEARAGRLWACSTLILIAGAVFVFDRLAQWSLVHHGRAFGEEAARAMSLAIASARLYAQPELFEPWQPWSYALIHDGWWHLSANLATLLLVGRALEQRIGGLSLLATALTIAPITAAAAILIGAEPGLSGVCCGWFALLVTREPRARVRWGLSYYLVLVVGHLPLFRLPVTTLWLLYLLQEAVRLTLSHEPAPWAWWGAATIAGVGLGHASRRFQPTET